MEPSVSAVMAMSGILTISQIALKVIKVRSRQRRRRRYKTRPLNRARHQLGHFETLLPFAKAHDHQQFFKYTRLTPDQFDFLLKLVDTHLQKDKSKNPLSLAHRLSMTLHYLAEGCSMQQIAWDFYVGKSTVHCVVKETCEVLWRILSPKYMAEPTRADWESISEGFYKKWNVPNTLGALDGKHVAIQAPSHSGTDYFNNKKHFRLFICSLVIMGVCDAFYRFTLVDIGAPGSNHDSSVFKMSPFGEAVMSDGLDFPQDKPLPGMRHPLPYFFAADQAFPLHKRIMRPYPGERLGEIRNIFNYRLSRARRTIENTFGILAQRWRILRRTIVASVETSESIVKACVVMHNFVQCREMDIPLAERQYCPTGYTDYVDNNGQFHYGQWREENVNLRSVGRIGSNNSAQNIKNNRDVLANYFVSRHGTVPWQEEYVARGSFPTI